MAFTLLLALPCVAAFLVVPDLICGRCSCAGSSPPRMQQAAGWMLAACTLGLIPFVLDAQRRLEDSWRAATRRPP